MSIYEFILFEASSSCVVQRLHAEYAESYSRGLGVPAHIGYVPHHEAPSRKPRHVDQRDVLSARRVALQGDDTSIVGDMTVENELGFVGDNAEGAASAVHQNDVVEVATGTARAHSIEVWLWRVCDVVGLIRGVHVQKQEGVRSEYARLVFGLAEVTSLGWTPRLKLAVVPALMLRR